MRVVVGQDYGEDSYHSHTQVVLEELFDNDSLHCTTGALSAPVRKANASNNPKATYGSFSVTTSFLHLSADLYPLPHYWRLESWLNL